MSHCKLMAIAVMVSGLLLSPVSAQSQQTAGTARVSGVVLTGSTERPIRAAEILLTGGPSPQARRAISDTTGSFMLSDVPPGRHRLTARAVGYQPVIVDLDVSAGGLEEVEILLRPVTTELERVDVRANAVPVYLRDFDSRRKMGFGKFFDSTALWAGGDPMRWAENLAAQVPGLRATGYGSSKAFTTGRGVGSGRAMPSGDQVDVMRGARPACYARIIIDGIVRYNSDLGESLFDLTNWLGPPFVAAEFYMPSQLPAEFNRLGAASCGALVLWTRR